MSLFLAQSWSPDGAEHGSFAFSLRNTGAVELRFGRFCYASMTRLRDDVAVRGGRVTAKFANHVEITPDAPVTLAPGESWQVSLSGLSHKPDNRTQGAMAAWVETDSGPVEALVGDLAPPEGTPRHPVKDWPAGKAQPLALLPWPAAAEVAGTAALPRLCPAEGADPAPFLRVAALHRRLFPSAPAPVSADPRDDARPVTLHTDPTIAAEGYTLAFAPAQITLRHADARGLQHGLVALAQIGHAALTDPRFHAPDTGHIADAPRFGWRGCHLDVARNFRSAAEVTRLIDILAWHRMSHLHWHLCDDEGYRLPSRAFQGLAGLAARRGAGAAMPPQYADGPAGQQGSYTEAEVRDVLAHATDLGIEVMPELDIPGHVTALLTAIPGLRDPDETPDSYRSVQGYPNNALNPALPRTYEVVETLIDEVCALFPYEVLHIGSDEVDTAAWTQSPAAQALAEAEGLDSGPDRTMQLQALFLRRVQAMLAARGKRLGGWDECAEGGGVDRQGTLLFAWRSVETTARLMADGYDVIATPGQAYYLDMVQGAGWDSAGTSWAGPVPVARTYAFDPAAGLPEGPGRLIGVQAGIWTEHINSTERFNHMVFPRLSAIAEAGWTPQPARDFDRFAALSQLMPQL